MLIAACYSPDARNWPTPEPDAAVDASADASVDARIPDAPGPVYIHLQVMGGGKIALGTTTTCDMDCIVAVPYGEPVTVFAIANTKQMFAGWTSTTCAGQPAECTFVPVAAATVGARFVKGDG